MEDIKGLCHNLACMGAALMSYGAENYRAEDTVIRIAHFYGALDAEVFIIPSLVTITIGDEEGSRITESKRISAFSNDLTLISSLNKLSRDICSGLIAEDEYGTELNKILSTKPRSLKLIIGAALATGFLCAFFGGTVLDSIVSACLGILIHFIVTRLTPYSFNNFFTTFVASITAGFIILLLYILFPVIHYDKIMIGDIMLLIPGLMFFSSIRDLLLRDIISGSIRLLESLLITFALSIGFIIPLFLLRSYL